MKNFSKNIILWIVIGMLLIALFNLFQGSSSNNSTTTVSFSDFMAAVEAGNVSEVNIRGNNVEGYLKHHFGDWKKKVDDWKSYRDDKALIHCTPENFLKI